MRPLIRYAIPFLWIGSAQAQSPPVDSSPRIFAGEWAGTGDQGAYCYAVLDIDGTGRVLVDVGSGDWRGARIQWRNRQQSLDVTAVAPMLASSRLRLMPLGSLTLTSRFNTSLRLTWHAQTPPCHLQRVDATARRLSRARSTMEGKPADGAAR